MVTSKSDSVSSFAKSMSEEISAVTEPVTAASEEFLKDYNTKLDALLSEVLGDDDESDTSAAVHGRSALSSTDADASEEVVGHKEVGVGSWISSLVTMGAVVCGVYFESQRSKNRSSPSRYR